LVAGGTGLIGTGVVRAMLKQKASVCSMMIILTSDRIIQILIIFISSIRVFTYYRRKKLDLFNGIFEFARKIKKNYDTATKMVPRMSKRLTRNAQ
jgi:hypothetical protein